MAIQSCSPPVALPTEEQHFAAAPLQGPRDAGSFLPDAQLLDPTGAQHILARKHPELPTCSRERALESAGPKGASTVPGLRAAVAELTGKEEDPLGEYILESSIDDSWEAGPGVCDGEGTLNA